MKRFSDLTENQINRNNAAISIPKYAISHLPIVKVTDKAICIQMDNSSYVHESIKNVWLPISQITIHRTFTKKNFVDSNPSDESENCFYFEISLPEWLAMRNKLN